jgi:hypothetical protein
MEKSRSADRSERRGSTKVPGLSASLAQFKPALRGPDRKRGRQSRVTSVQLNMALKSLSCGEWIGSMDSFIFKLLYRRGD